MEEIGVTIDNTSYNIRYEYDVSDDLAWQHMQKLIEYFRKFDKDSVFIWVPGAADEECEFGLYPDPDADYSQSGGYGKDIILTRGGEAAQAFGADWRKEHIEYADVSWNISEKEHLKTLQEHDSIVEANRVGML